MTNPFENRTSSLAGPATDILPVSPDDVTELPDVAIALYIETGGTLSLLTARGGQRSVSVADHSILPVGTRRVNASGTTATGIHAMVIS
ncbi:MAG: spike base protein, RCAP_Rcc01079 family [Marinosulfonomonas sp.]